MFISTSSVFNNDNVANNNSKVVGNSFLLLNSSNSVRNGGGGSCCCCCCCKCCCRCKCADANVGSNLGFSGRARSESQCEYSPQERNDAQGPMLQNVSFITTAWHCEVKINRTKVESKQASKLHVQFQLLP